MPLSEEPSQKPENFDAKVEGFKLMSQNNPLNYREAIFGLRDMAAGEDLDGVRDVYYPEWEDADFEKLIEELERPKGFYEKVREFKLMKENNPSKYNEAIAGLDDMAKGKDLDGIRDEFYPGWTDVDFVNLLNDLGIF